MAHTHTCMTTIDCDAIAAKKRLAPQVLEQPDSMRHRFLNNRIQDLTCYRNARFGVYCGSLQSVGSCSLQEVGVSGGGWLGGEMFSTKSSRRKHIHSHVIAHTQTQTHCELHVHISRAHSCRHTHVNIQTHARRDA